MAGLKRIAFIGNSPPRQCGIATFTSHLQSAVQASSATIGTVIVALNDHGQAYDYPDNVFVQINDQDIQDYVRAARILNAGDYDVVSLQHEFGIFGGEAGAHILELLTRLTMPVVTTFHTVLESPSPAQRKVMKKIIALSASVVVMANRGRDLLTTTYATPADKIQVIPHGVPDLEFTEPEAAKQKTGLADKSVILTFGLLSPNKGIEVMIDAMPEILAHTPDAVYVVLGATHPNLLRLQGETYRQSLQARAASLGVQDSVIFLNQFVDEAVLLDYIAACDAYVTPYPDQAQMTSGTLAYSFGLGKAVVSTPYWHAQELLADDHGVFVPFADAPAMSAALVGLLTDKTKRNALRQRAYAKSRSMVWSQAAQRYLGVFRQSVAARAIKIITRTPRTLADGREALALPEMRKTHLQVMCDDTGLFQHAVHSIPDRSHGYCVDDNARALLLACTVAASHEEDLADMLISRFCAFIQHAYNPDNQRFRNFMGFDRRWLEPCGSEDSHGRTMWALGACATNVASASRRQWAADLFAKALPATETFTSPRAWAFVLLGLDAYCQGPEAERLRIVFADRLLSLLISTEREDWVWFEDSLSYDNARLPQAMLLTGIATHTPAFVAAGLRTLHWLMDLQIAPNSWFRPVGSSSFGNIFAQPQCFDQQPIEATAAISACLAALQADTSGFDWRASAQTAFKWFTGSNDLAVPLVDVATGRCRDGLHPDRVNENCGGESVVSYLLSLVEMRQLQSESDDYPAIVPMRISATNIHKFPPSRRDRE